MKRFLTTLGAAATFAAAGNATAALGDLVYALDGDTDVVATFVTNGGAGFTNVLFVASPRSITDIFNNQEAVAGDQTVLGRFSPLDEIRFGIDVYPDGLSGGLGATYFSGPASRNGDGVAHAIVTDIGGGSVRVAFEDLPGEGGNYEDLVFTLSNAAVVAAPVPEPETYALLLAGLGIVGWAARRRRAA